MRASCWPFPDVATARAGGRDGSPWFVRLDGTWRFTLAGSPDALPDGFEQPAFDTSGWSEVSVPSLFTMMGDERARPIYTNVQMPFSQWPPRVPDENPTGVYRRTFAVPAEWDGRRVVLHVGGAESMLFVWVNGRAVGVSTDSRLAAEFDITDHVSPGADNVAVFAVVRWSASSYVEDQDQWWHAGLHREVALFSTDTIPRERQSRRRARGRRHDRDAGRRCRGRVGARHGARHRLARQGACRDARRPRGEGDRHARRRRAGRPDAVPVRRPRGARARRGAGGVGLDARDARRCTGWS